MATLFSELMRFFGITGAPATFAEFVPWVFQVLCALGLFLFAFWMIERLVRNVTRTRW